MANTTTEQLAGTLHVPYFRPLISEAEIEEVVACLRSGWLTTGPRTREFEQAFGEAVGAQHAVGVNSCTAALHLAVHSLGLARQSLTFSGTKADRNRSIGGGYQRDR